MDYQDILKAPTSNAWVTSALKHQATLLIDHAHCERKAAQNAMSLIFKYPEYTGLLDRLSKLVREEMVHFEQVLALMKKANIKFKGLKSGGYAAHLATLVRDDHPLSRLVDQLLVAAIIEARSCERLGMLAPHLEPGLAKFYHKLHQAERRHCEVFVAMAAEVAGCDLSKRLDVLAQAEADWLAQPDPLLRCHSGEPMEFVHG